MTTDDIPEQTGESGVDVSDDKSVFGIITGIFTSPTEAFESFDKIASFKVIIVPLIIVVLATMVMTLASAQFEAQDQYNLLKNSTVFPQSELQKMQDKAQEGASGSDLALKAVLTILAIPAMTTLVSLIVWGMGNFIFGGKTNFTRVWGVTILAGLIGGLNSLLKVPLILAKGTTSVTYGLAALMPGKNVTSMLYFFFLSLDGFVIWATIVGGLGYAVIYKFTPGKGIVLSTVVTLLGVAVGMAGVAIGMSFAGVEISII